VFCLTCSSNANVFVVDRKQLSTITNVREHKVIYRNLQWNHAFDSVASSAALSLGQQFISTNFHTIITDCPACVHVVIRVGLVHNRTLHALMVSINRFTLRTAVESFMALLSFLSLQVNRGRLKAEISSGSSLSYIDQCTRNVETRTKTDRVI